MRTCAQCGKKGLFLKLTSDGICNDCIERNKQAAELEKQRLINQTKAFINEIVSYSETAFRQLVVYPSLGRETLLEQKNACDYLCKHIDDWKKFAYFNESIKQTAIKNEFGDYRHPLLGRMIVHDFRSLDFDKLFSEMKRKASDLSTRCYLASLDAYDYSQLYHVVGVTFKNGRRSRQTILRQIRFHDGEYNSEPKFDLRRWVFEGEDAVAVYANEEQVGNIAKADLPWLLDHWDEYSGIDEYDITGSTSLNFGLFIRACFRRKEK